ncbi:PMS1 protein homolog 1-like isoform X2 [Portunus trituberculatus]|uniref:PMS1 protein homolog 1-like isoform X2 n=1 Tax=Portunus trituberculatus TaxID=210409 RepID=UPI001E1CCCD6|nr:PMS1 protein homolog 1-like isoform X2 [Portunus trituberculatus]
MVVQELSQDTVRLIKSTQVITTPVSIVKELLENSIDAGAASVTIRLEKYGFGVVEVRDNGSGIEENDVKFIAKPHFTSKIESFADLASLNTYGFRGEALAALCAVAEVSITTKTKDAVMGQTYMFDHTGTVTSKKPAPAPNGTSIMARNLFKNLPVRKQYYSSSRRQKEELKKVEDLVVAFTLAAPAVHLTLSHDRLAIIQKSSVKNVGEVLMSTFPAVFKKLVLRERNIENIHITTYLPSSGPYENPSLSRATPDRFFVLVNQRPVVHKSIEKMVKAFYSQKVQGSHGRYPLGVVSLSVPPASVDVNLEPNKTKNLVLETVQEILSELYGPLEQHPKKPNNDVTSDKMDVITCTFGSLQENSGLQAEENIYNDENEIKDCFVDTNDKRGAVVFNGKIGAAHTKQTTFGSVGRGITVSGIIRDSEKCGSALEKDTCSKPFQVRQMEKEQKNTSLTSNKTVSSSALLTLNHRNAEEESCCGKNNAVCASTPKDADACFPTISQSSIASDDDFENLLHENDLSATKGFEKEISGIASLPLSCIAEVCGSGCVKKNNAALEQNCQNVLSKSNFDESKLHESFTGSDGIPVYKIPPLPPLKETENEQVNDKSEEFSKQERDLFSKESLEDISPLHSGPGEREGSVGGAWSRGMAVEGKNVQTVQVVSTAALGSKVMSGQAAARTAKRHLLPREAGSMSTTPPKKTKINSLAPAHYDHSQGTPLKKPSSPFILFARDIRRQVLREHPGADFAFVAKEMAVRWKTLDTDSKSHYREQAKAEAERFHMQVKLMKESRARSGGSPMARGCSTAGSLDRYIAPLTPYIKNKGKVIRQERFTGGRPWLQHRKDIKCSLDAIKEKMNKKNCAKNTKNIRNSDDILTILGQVTSNGGWVCVLGSDIVALNVYRVYEIVLYNNLLKTFKLSMKSLDTSIPFNASNVGMENWTALLMLPRELVPDRNFYWVTDQRLMANGFHIALFPGTTASVTISHGEITQMAHTVKFYGITDLKEILSLLAASPLASLQQTRPLKLQHWIKEEVVRLVRSAPNILRQEDVLEKVKSLHLLSSGTKEVEQLPLDLKCIHGKPVFTRLHSLPDLPSLEQEHSNIPTKVI